ncbi:hypothetical protein Taro_010479 [Colocasia esculenta]|uniref:Uncharacterized protein n=1 Tax=Colocasia esculenta TaxID=4460 RepID=A0A843U3D5_COLES|nr:hypothetical protein [Colocasia esculenta]
MASSGIALSRFAFFGTTRGAPKIRSFSTLQAAEPRASEALEQDFQLRLRISFASVPQRYGFPASGLSQFIESNRLLLDSDHLDVQRCMGVLLSFGLSQDALVSVVSEVPGAGFSE